jgi:cold-inducible RNA-binding protein
LKLERVQKVFAKLVESYRVLSMKLSIGNIPQTLTEEDLQKLFTEFGKVESVSIKRDKKTGTSLGYGSIEIADESAAKAIEALHGKEMEGKKIAVVDASKLPGSQESDKLKDKSTLNQKVNPRSSGGGFTGGAVRRSGGGGRGK